MYSIVKLDYFMEINTRDYLVDIPTFSLKIFLLCGEMCPSSFLCGSVHTPDDAMIN